MINNQLLQYVKDQVALGTSQEKIRQDLINSGGWTHSDIDEVFSIINNMTSSNPSSEQVIPVAPVRYAGFWIRWVAYMVDNFFLMLILVPTFFVVGVIIFSINSSFSVENILNSNLVTNILIPAMQIILVSSYFIFMTYKKGATFGKRLVGIEVISDVPNSDRTFGQIVLRETLGKIASGIILGIGFLMIAFTKRKQALHDKGSQTVVVYKSSNQGLSTGAKIGIAVALILPTLAILGILSSVVLASLNVAKQKGLDASIKANLTNLKVQSEMYYLANNTYGSAQNCFSGVFLEREHANLVSENQSKDISCKAYPTSYAISAQLVHEKAYFCVDSGGYGDYGVLIDDGERMYCKSMNQTTEEAVANQKITTSTYSLELPSGWRVAKNTESTVAVVNPALKSTIVINKMQLDGQNININSIFDAVNEDWLLASLKTEFPNIVVQNISSTSVDGVGAFISTFNTGELRNEQGVSSYLAAVQYNMIREGYNYNIIIMSNTGPSGGSLAFDAHSIMNNFQFTE